MLSAVNVLKNTPKIFNMIQKHFFQLNLSWINGKLGEKYCHADLDSVWDP